MDRQVLEDRKKLIQNIRQNRNRSWKEIQTEVPEGHFLACTSCQSVLHKLIWEEEMYECPECHAHQQLPFVFRMERILDETYTAKESPFVSTNPIDFPGYEEKIASTQEKSGQKEALQWGEASIEGMPLVYIHMDTSFMMASMGTYVGEEIARAFEYAKAKSYPLIAFIASGGARMQEGIFSLFQMAKTIAAMKQFQDDGNLYVSVLCNPTTGGVNASFALLADINLAEPSALIGFAGPRVIKETIGQELPKGFQSAEYMQEKGFIDAIVPRKEQRAYLAKLLRLHREV